jgi:hypothetical protein
LATRMVNKNPKEKQHVKLDSHIEIIPLSLGGNRNQRTEHLRPKADRKPKSENPQQMRISSKFPIF